MTGKLKNIEDIKKMDMVTAVSYYQLVANSMADLSNQDVIFLKNTLEHFGFHMVCIDNVEQERMHYAADNTSGPVKEVGRTNAYAWFKYDEDGEET